MCRYYSLDCVESRCTVLEYPEYCRRRADQARAAASDARTRMLDDVTVEDTLDEGATAPQEEILYFVRDWYDNEDLHRAQHSHRSKRSMGESGAAGSGNSSRKQPRVAEALGMTKDTVNLRNKKGETKLHQACIKGNIVQVKQLLQLRASVDVTCNAGWTPLHEACVKTHVDIAELLLRRDADPNIPSPDGTLPLHDAAANGSVDLVKLLLRNGASAEVGVPLPTVFHLCCCTCTRACMCSSRDGTRLGEAHQPRHSLRFGAAI